MNGFAPQVIADHGLRVVSDVDFVLASERTQSSVVFIQTLSEYEYRTGSWLDWFFEPRSSQQISSGSGVILSEDGYIVTNNHVIENADRIKVVHGKKTYDAKMIGKDPSTDLAVLKIEMNDLPAIQFANSDDVSVGQWVLAVGNPFNLTSTVTAGIVSAKGRNINILKDKFPIESFIQTDAAINPGNSGGALVNTQGALIGINTAILSRTGTYSGYGFAVPSNIVRKVFDDVRKYGEVQKAFTGAEFIDIN
ncbi:MAG: trypsin-like peptidase domain-containing protein, partial [Marinoscillum sp.]